MFGLFTKKPKGEMPDAAAETDVDNAGYWTEHNVTLHAQFPDARASLDYFDWRNDQYYRYIDLMPVTGQDGKVVLDYGCGPGNDLVGFGVYSKPTRLIGADISVSSLREAKARLALHGVEAEYIRITEDTNRLPLDDGSVDYIHSSGVVHHTKSPETVLREFRRVLRAGGAGRIMVYNYDSLWVHLYVAYVKKLKEGLFADLDIRSAFAKTTDGPNCPISRCYRPEEFCRLAESCGFRCEYTGAAISMWECLQFQQYRWEAIMNQTLPLEHRRFLTELTLDDRGIPMYRGHYAGVDGCYRLTAA
jgi:ubiquinone/menaquinone biosynthesis C-methylase UbiE